MAFRSIILEERKMGFLRWFLGEFLFDVKNLDLSGCAWMLHVVLFLCCGAAVSVVLPIFLLFALVGG